jgi:hypothetical protein
VAVSFNARTSTGTVVEVLTAAHIELAGVESNEADGTERRYYVRAEHGDGDHDDLRSHVFGPSFTGKHTWENVIFPVAGSWTLELRDVSDDSVEATDTLTVAALS